jgi:NAD(P)-dependent dehydrogenase (short-subunit alcohol dehydrogenase family)
LARDGAAHDILVNAVAPGFIETKFHTQVMGRSPEDLKKRAELVPLKRAGRPDDVARMIVYLLSPGGDYITGQCLAVSGGDWL